MHSLPWTYTLFVLGCHPHLIQVWVFRDRDLKKETATVEYTLGIDPGMKGGWAVIGEGYDGYYIAGGRIPTKAYGKRRRVDTDAWKQAFYDQKVYSVDRAVCEMVWSSPQQGVVSAFSMGSALASALAMCEIYFEVEPVLVTPVAWKKSFGLSSDKRASLDLAKDYWPDAPVKWDVLANDGIAEAALMARWLDNQG